MTKSNQSFSDFVSVSAATETSRKFHFLSSFFISRTRKKQKIKKWRSQFCQEGAAFSGKAPVVLGRKNSLLRCNLVAFIDFGSSEEKPNSNVSAKVRSQPVFRRQRNRQEVRFEISKTVFFSGLEPVTPSTQIVRSWVVCWCAAMTWSRTRDLWPRRPTTTTAAPGAARATRPSRPLRIVKPSGRRSGSAALSALLTACQSTSAPSLGKASLLKALPRIQ